MSEENVRTSFNNSNIRKWRRIISNFNKLSHDRNLVEHHLTAWGACSRIRLEMRLMHKFKIRAKPPKPLSTTCSLAFNKHYRLYLLQHDDYVFQRRLFMMMTMILCVLFIQAFMLSRFSAFHSQTLPMRCCLCSSTHDEYYIVH